MALMQLSIVYYVGCVVVHCVFPRMASPTLPLSKQTAESKQIMREVAQSFVVLIVKALVFVVVEKLFEYKLAKLHDDPFIVDQLYWQVRTGLSFYSTRVFTLKKANHFFPSMIRFHW